MTSNRLNSLRRGYTALTILIINTVLVLAVVEGAARLWDTVDRKVRPYRDSRSDLSYYQSAPWGQPYWSEHTLSSHERYEPFVVWRRSPFAGKFINIDSAGLRIAPQLPCADSAVHIAVFGGSTVWGTGSPDEFTIPAQLQRTLNHTGQQSFCVTNYGESGYVTGQEVIAILGHLRSGAPLDVAIFYDGINDIYAAYQTGRTNAHQNLAQIAARFDVSKKRSLPHRVEDWLYENSSAYRRIRNVAPSSSPLSGDITLSAEDSALVEGAVGNYLFNVDFVRRLGRSYDFETFFFWQPVIYTSQKQLSADERTMLGDLDSRAIQFYKYAARALAARSDSNVVDLTRVFDDRKEMIWIDWAHVTPEGNGIVAQEIASRIGR